MTDFDATDDEVVSAYLDGEATPDEVARVEAEPHLLARADQLRQVVEAVRAAPSATIDNQVRDTAIAAALAAPTPRSPSASSASSTTSGSGAAVPAATSDELSARRAKRARRAAHDSRGTTPAARRNRLASAAAVVVLLLAAGSVLFNQLDRDRNGSPVASATTDISREGTSAGGDGAGGPATEADALAAAAYFPQLGSFDRPDELAVAVAGHIADRAATGAMVDSPTSTTPLTGEGPAATTTTADDTAAPAPSDVGGEIDKGIDQADAEACAHLLKDDGVERGELVLTAVADYLGGPVFVLVFERSAGRDEQPTQHLWVLSLECDPMFDRSL